MKISLTGTLLAFLVAGGLPLVALAQTPVPPVTPPKPPMANPAAPSKPPALAAPAPAPAAPAPAAPTAATPPAAPAAGAPAAPPKANELPQALKDMDADNDGAVSEDEFIKYRMRFFDALDANKDGSLTREEFLKLAEPPYVDANDTNQPPLVQRKRFLNDEFTALDADQDGKLTHEEATAAFKANFQQVDRNHDGKITVADMEVQDTPQQITRAQFIENDMKAFDRLDVNKDGKVSFEEFSVLGANASPDAGAQVKEQLTTDFKTMDTNKDGFVSKQEFTDFSGKTFDRADTNHDGIMSAEEAAVAARAAEIARQSITRQQFVDNQVVRYMTELDANKDGKISRVEFMALAGDPNQKPVAGQRPYKEKAIFFGQQFDEIDANKDGGIDRTELANYWTKIFNNLDTNKDGRLTAQEIAAANKPATPPAPKPPAAGNTPKPPAAPTAPKPAAPPKPMQPAPQSGGSAQPQAPIVTPPPQQMR